MSTRGDQRRGLQGLTNDPWRKLVALALAIGLWFWLDSKVTTSKDQQCELQTVNSIREVLLDSSNAVVAILVPRDYSKRGFRDAVSDEEITGVTLRFEGPSGLISNIGRNEQFWVEPTGRVHDTTELFTRASFLASIRPQPGGSIYTRYGDTPLFLLLALGFGLLLVIRRVAQQRA